MKSEYCLPSHSIQIRFFIFILFLLPMRGYSQHFNDLVAPVMPQALTELAYKSRPNFLNTDSVSRSTKMTRSWIGGSSALLYMVTIEWMDAHSEKWGWSWGDISADIFGTALFVSQVLGWQEQRIQYKFSFHHKNYNELELNERADVMFGKSGFKRTLQDYNAQTYWFAGNLRSFFKQSRLPPWLNVAIGYGSDGMFGELENKWVNDSGTSVDRTNIARIRQFYLAPDIDFTKIKTNKKWLRTVFFCLNAFKCPAPALIITSKGTVKFYPVYF